jgi:6,7-dimethyl-8-ribityllumazine synthase
MVQRRKTAAKKAKQTAKSGGARSQRPMRILIVESRYYEPIADQLLAGACAALEEAGTAYDIVTVPGALEIPPAIAIAVDAAQLRKEPYEGVVALGCVIQGETFHFDVVATQSARALMDFSVAHRMPLGNGILTVDTEAQAVSRASVSEGNKGGEAAKATLALAGLKRDLGQRR